MPLGTCHYCRQAPATDGYPDLPATQHCRDCYLVRSLSSSISDIRIDVAASTSIDHLRRALDWETHGRRRITVLDLLRRRIRHLERAAQ